MFSTTRRSHVFRLVLATLTTAVFTAGPVHAQAAGGTICIHLGPPNDICVDDPLTEPAD